MKQSAIYLHFEGQCREAMTFYAACFGTTVGLTPYGATPPGEIPGAELAPELIMHAELAVPGLHLMASDTLPGDTLAIGNNFSVSLACSSHLEMENLFQALMTDGVLNMALKDAFWGDRIGRVTDRFGVCWLLSFRAD